jgi:hypothetical protein
MEVIGKIYAPIALIPVKELPDWVGPTAGLDAVEETKISAGYRTPPVQPVARRYNDWTMPASVDYGVQYRVASTIMK